MVSHDPELNSTVEELLDQQLALDSGADNPSSFTQWGKNAPFVQWSKLGAGPFRA
ncbi:hypothetical protein [Plantactinospora sp. CA-290183]|uniref:hypothetical protein n=1 Tax=Plantactinospora sp. CA-290183 TaxID=3240006 RepID=UPI003D92BF12